MSVFAAYIFNFFRKVDFSIYENLFENFTHAMQAGGGCAYIVHINTGIPYI